MKICAIVSNSEKKQSKTRSPPFGGVKQNATSFKNAADILYEIALVALKTPSGSSALHQTKSRNTLAVLGQAALELFNNLRNNKTVETTEQIVHVSKILNDDE